MAFKLIDATEMRVGTFLLIDGDAYTVKSMDVSKTGKHGHAKVRFEAVSLTGGRKKVLVVPGHERFEVPVIDKRKAQVLSIAGENVNLMDSESFENLELVIPEDLKNEIQEGGNIEYWDIEGKKIIKRIL
jgi:translation initiation factor 5A